MCVCTYMYIYNADRIEWTTFTNRLSMTGEDLMRGFHIRMKY
jgi:hypothetical protein